MQLVAYGAQDAYLTGNPQITFFRVVYRRHTNFAMESMAQTLNGTADFGRKMTALIARNGDLIHKAYLQIDLPDLAPSSGTNSVAWTRNLGHAMIKETSIEVGGARIDTQYGQWLDIWNELTLPASKQDGYKVMIGNTSALTGDEGSYGVAGTITGNLIANNAISGNNIVSPPDIFDDALLFGGM